MKALFALLSAILLLNACGKSANPAETRATIDFKRVQWYAKRANAAYQSADEIRREFPDTILVASTPKGVQYFLEKDNSKGVQVLVIRGTDNLANIREDAECVESRNSKLGIYVHNGFDEDAQQIFEDILPRLDKSRELIVTGHSLGAAVSTILMMYFHEEGFTLGPSINFGQPKVTNKAGVEKYRSLPLLRVVDKDDPVPLVPPNDLIDSIHGDYEHLGAEILLLHGKYYVYADRHVARKLSVDSFWKNLGNEHVSDHRMVHYLHNIAEKLIAAVQVPYDKRLAYLEN